MQAFGAGGRAVVGDFVALFGSVLAIVGTPSLPVALGAFVAVTALQGWLGWRQAKSVVALTQEVMLALRQRLFAAICRAEWAVFSRYRSSDLIEALIGKIDRFGAYSLLTCLSAVMAWSSRSALKSPLDDRAHRRRGAPCACFFWQAPEGRQWRSSARTGDVRAVTESLAAEIGRSYVAEYAHIGSFDSPAARSATCTSSWRRVPSP